VAERVQAILEFARVDDLAVELRRGVQVVVVVVQARVAQRVAWSPVSMPSVAQVSRPSAFTSRIIAATFGMSRSFGERHAAPMQKREAPASRAWRAFSSDGLGAHELRGVHAGVVARGLRAIAAVLGQPPVFTDSKRGDLDFGGIEVLAVDAAGAMQQLR
jgi:hypothetical protein